MILLDNSGADAVLGMIPLARELARRGAHVVLAANSLPALNDITDLELRQVGGSERERGELVDLHGRWKRPCLQTAHMTI